MVIQPENKINGIIVFQYKITLEANHENMMKLDSYLQSPPKDDPDDLHDVTEKCCSMLADVFHTDGGIKEEKFEAQLTPRGTRFITKEVELEYNNQVNQYCDLVSACSLENFAWNKVNFKLHASSFSEAKNANGEVVSGPRRHIPIL